MVIQLIRAGLRDGSNRTFMELKLMQEEDRRCIAKF